MAIILDADVLIRGERGTFDLGSWLAGRAAERFELVAVTVAELWHGVERAREHKRPVREAYLRTLLANLPVIPYTLEAALEHARIWAQLEQAGRMIGAYDLIVAATALVRGSSVATFNQRHFEQIAGLKVIRPEL